MPSAGAMLLRPEVSDSLEIGRWPPAASDERGVGLADEVCGFGFDVVDALRVLGLGAGVGSCLALEAAVGAVRCDGRLTGFVTSRGFGFEVGDVFVLGALSDAPDLAIEAAVGAVSELLLAFFIGALWVDRFGESLADDEAWPETGVFG